MHFIIRVSGRFLAQNLYRYYVKLIQYHFEQKIILLVKTNEKLNIGKLHLIEANQIFYF